ncbi:hypothetical protein JDV02_008379 [Purpureocillium takamizusanense]|uniref:Uncharacterized protein n=1 Tax=Purpureocillium takamizusanense TaxID=2060973 RepID=A0A9Q8QMN5_9HYPO|nr:uncharacterized protein JDV02_008379 [Purpureocillium takamizusanense]UNI22493.1 hypothetical protein JDV02_008379 [Purpureocillium takamizusanense]
MHQEVAQEWADKRGFQTLTTAMGPLMDPSDPKCPKHKGGQTSWSKYVHGASVVFAWYIAQGDLATVLAQPPPQRFHPSGLTYYQLIEEPILKGKLGNRPVNKIVVVHPTVGEAADFTYELWPHDEPSLWTTSFDIPDTVRYWRQVKLPKGAKKSSNCESTDATTNKTKSSKSKQIVVHSSTTSTPPKDGSKTALNGHKGTKKGRRGKQCASAGCGLPSKGKADMKQENEPSGAQHEKKKKTKKKKKNDNGKANKNGNSCDGKRGGVKVTNGEQQCKKKGKAKKKKAAKVAAQKAMSKESKAKSCHGSLGKTKRSHKLNTEPKRRAWELQIRREFQLD